MKKYLSLLLLITPILNAYDVPYQMQVAQKHLTSLDQIKDKSKDETLKLNMEKPWDVIKSFFQPNPFKVQELDEYHMHERVNSFTAAKFIPRDSIMGVNEVNKLDLVAGSGKNVQAHLQNVLTTSKDKQLLRTTIGQKVFRELLTQPADIKDAQLRADAIKSLINDKSLLNECANALKSFRKSESRFLKFFQEDELVDTELLNQVRWSKFWTKPLNDSTVTLEAGTQLNNAQIGLALGSIPFTLFYGLYKADQNIRNQNIRNNNLDIGLWDTAKFLYQSCDPLQKRFIKGGIAFYGTLIGGSYILSATHALAKFKINKNINNLLQEYLIGAASCVNAMKEMYLLSKENKDLSRFPECKQLKKIFESTESEIEQLIDLFDTNTFKGSSSFFSLTGRVLRAYHLMRLPEVQKALRKSMQAVGLIDSLVAVTQKVKSLPRDAWCFAEFSQDDKPRIQATQFYNPFLNPDQAVKNDITLGGPQPRGIILTGPNTGGKSTAMKALMLNTLLSHTFGIACAQEFKTSQFSKLSCYLNITDDLAAGLSGLKAEVDRAKEIVKEVQSLKANEFAFIVLDEIFTATSPDQAMKLAEKFITQLGASDRCLLIDATHFYNLIGLEDKSPDIFKNYHVGAILNENNEVVKYTYTLEEGPSQVQNAGQVAAEYDL